MIPLNIHSFNHMKKSIFIAWLLCATSILAAQDSTWEEDPVTHRFSEQLAAFPHEKLYVQTDKSSYLSGGRVWLRVHLVDATTHMPAFLSRYVYLELFNPFEELMERVKIRPDSTGVYSGYLDLEEDLAQGDYTIRAYTRYARNRGNEAFFKKSINVLDPYSLQIQPHPRFEVDNRRVNAHFTFVDRVSGDTIAPEIVTMKLADETTRTISPKNKIDFNTSFSLSRRNNNRNLLLSIVHEGRKYNRYYPIPYADDDFEVTFHPEGGYLVPGHTCRVGFKALNPSGFGESIAGKVYNSANEEVATFTTYRLGMGSFHLSVKPGETYHAVCETKNGMVKRVDLPVAEPLARTLSVKRAAGRIIATFLKGEATPDIPVSLLVHNKGIVLYHQPWSAQTDSYAFPADIMPSGITSFLLLDDENEILSERLIFNINEGDLARMESDLSSPAYKPRERIALTLRLADIDTLTFYNNLAISVTDKNSAIQNNTNHLMSTLLLSSELQGYIESPASYFTGSKTDPLALDALLTTQGWRRYDIPGVLKGAISTPDSFLPEQFQEISGKTEALLRSMKEGEISLIATLDSLVSTVTTTADEKGRFLFKAEYPEGTEITVQSLSKKGSRSNLIHIDPVTFPDVSHSTLPARGQTTHQFDLERDAYLKKANDEYSLKYGMRTIMLEEVTITAQSRQSYSDSKYYSPISSTGLVTAQDIEERKISSLRSLLTSTPGIIMRPDRVTTTRSDLPVIFVIDDIPYEDFFDQLDGLDVSAIDNLFIMRDNTSMLGYYPGTDGAVVITTKRGFVQTNTLSKNIDRIQPLGYQQPAEFYSPSYETPEQMDSPGPDFRTTIYWKPNVQFSLEGKAVVEFYTADVPTTYEVVGEGVTGTGKLIHFTKEIVVEKSNSR